MMRASRDRSPTVSVIVPTYNRSLFLREAVHSVLAQTHPVSEIVVVDDASDPEHQGVLQELASRPSVRVLRRATNGGSSRARNLGLELATGDFVLFLDDDDILLPDAVRVLLRKFAIDNETDIAVCRSLYLFRDRFREALALSPSAIDLRRPGGSGIAAWRGTSVRHFLDLEENPRTALLHWCPAVHSCLIRRTALASTRFAEDLEFGEDWDFWMRLARQRCRFRCETTALVLVRRHGGNRSLQAQRSHVCRVLHDFIALETTLSREERFVVCAMLARNDHGADRWLAAMRLVAQPDLFFKHGFRFAIRRLCRVFGARGADTTLQARNLDSIANSMNLAHCDVLTWRMMFRPADAPERVVSSESQSRRAWNPGARGGTEPESCPPQRICGGVMASS